MEAEFMALALAEARLAFEAGEVPVGAVVVREGRVIARAHNLRERRRDPLAHGELLALREAAAQKGDWRLGDCTLYVTLEPCPMCAGALVMAQLGRLVFGAFDPQQGCCGSVYDFCHDPAFHHHPQVSGGLMEEACQGLLTAFFARKRQRKD